MTPKDDATHYFELEQGALHLASLSASDAERFVHLDMADRYSRLALDAGDPGKR